MRRTDKTGGIALAGGGVAALLASACCVGPLVLVSAGLGGAWLGNLRAFEPYRPLFVALAVVALLVASRRVFRPVAECAPGEVCAVPAYRRAYRAIFWTITALVLVAFGFPYLAPLFY